jgi:hypothetical protein
MTEPKREEVLKPSPIPIIPISLDKDRHLRYDFGACKLVELALSALWGKKVTFSEAVEPGKAGIADILQVLHAGLVWEDPNLTLDQVSHWVGLGSLPYLQEKISQALVGQVTEDGRANGSKPDAGGEVTGADPLALSTT